MPVFIKHQRRRKDGDGEPKPTSKESKKETEREEGIHAPGNKEIPLFDMRLQKLEVPKWLVAQG